MPFLTVDDLNLYFELDGPAGAPMLLLSNPLGTNLEIWMPQMELLTQRFRVLRYDTRGHGQSSVPPGPYSIAGMAADVLALLDYLQIERTHFCGLSMGGQIGMWLGAHHPARIDRLVLANTSVRIGNPDLWNERIARLADGDMESIRQAVMQRWVTADFQTNAPRQFEILQHMLLAMSSEGFAAGAAALRDADMRPELPKLRLPTLVVVGRHDKVTRPVDGEMLARAIPGARQVVLNAAHLSNWEVAQSFTRHVMNFLAGGTEASPP